MTDGPFGNARSAGCGSTSEADRAYFATVYRELRALASYRIRHERPGHTLQCTALVNEVFVRLFSGSPVTFESRAHFFAAAANSMRRILLEHARNRGRQKRGGQRSRLPLDAVDLAVEFDSDEILVVDDALTRLEQQDAELARVVQLRFFAGLSERQAAEVLGVSDRTVRRDWKLARAWLARELRT